MGTRLLPVVICQAGSMFFGNFAYLSLSVAFIQILKVRPNSCRTLLTQLAAMVTAETCCGLACSCNGGLTKVMSCLM